MLQIYFWCLLGIVISTLLPPLWAYVRAKFTPPPPGQKGFAVADLIEFAKPYAALGFASALTAILLVAFAGDKMTSWQAALLAGYAWDSTLQKLGKPTKPGAAE